jgi:hypothetical protein
MESKIIQNFQDEFNQRPWHYRLKIHLRVRMWFWRKNVVHAWNWITSKKYRLSYGNCTFYCESCLIHNWAETDPYCKSNPKCTVKKNKVYYIDA